MSKTDPRTKTSAALLLAGGTSVRKTAAEVEVSESTLRAWRRQPEFAAVVAELAALVRAGGRTGPELFEACSKVLDRLDESGRTSSTALERSERDA